MMASSIATVQHGDSGSGGGEEGPVAAAGIAAPPSASMSVQVRVLEKRAVFVGEKEGREWRRRSLAGFYVDVGNGLLCVFFLRP